MEEVQVLTTSVAGRAFDFSHVVGGRQITGIVNIAFGEGDDVYIVKKAAGFSDVLKLSIGGEPDDGGSAARDNRSERAGVQQRPPRLSSCHDTEGGRRLRELTAPWRRAGYRDRAPHGHGDRRGRAGASV